MNARCLNTHPCPWRGYLILLSCMQFYSSRPFELFKLCSISATVRILCPHILRSVWREIRRAKDHTEGGCHPLCSSVIVGKVGWYLCKARPFGRNSSIKFGDQRDPFSSCSGTLWTAPSQGNSLATCPQPAIVWNRPGQIYSDPSIDRPFHRCHEVLPGLPRCMERQSYYDAEERRIQGRDGSTRSSTLSRHSHVLG